MFYIATYYLKMDIHQPATLLSAGCFIADSDWVHSARTIDSYELMVGVNGKVFIQQDNDQYILNEGDVVLLLPGHPHRGYRPSEKGTSFYWMHFLCNGQSDIIDSKKAVEEITLAKNNPFFNILDSKVLIPTFFRKPGTERIRILARQLLHIYEAKYYSRNAADYLLTSLLIELTNQAVINCDSSACKKMKDGKLPKILEWIRIHSSRNISLDDVAREFNYSKNYLARYFKKNMGMSMLEYIHKIKLAKAKELLCESDSSIKEIAALLGFEDQKYFMKLFKRYEKVTPYNYRKAYNLIHLNNN